MIPLIAASPNSSKWTAALTLSFSLTNPLTSRWQIARSLHYKMLRLTANMPEFHQKQSLGTKNILASPWSSRSRTRAGTAYGPVWKSATNNWLPAFFAAMMMFIWKGCTALQGKKISGESLRVRKCRYKSPSVKYVSLHNIRVTSRSWFPCARPYSHLYLSPALSHLYS